MPTPINLAQKRWMSLLLARASVPAVRSAYFSLPFAPAFIHQTQKPLNVRTSQASLSTSSTNTPLSFPCVDQNEAREKSLTDTKWVDRTTLPGVSKYVSSKPFYTVYGGSLPSFEIAYEAWGTLNEAKDNAILLCTGLSASSHAKSHDKNTNPGWWEKYLGPGAPLDTNKYYIICTNVIGGCFGSTGPSSIDPSTGARYATTFPMITVWDMMRAQFRMLDDMGIQKLFACVGSSMGGMQSLATAAMYPDRVGRLVSISAAARSHPYSIAMRYAQRQILMSDPNWNRGFYYDGIPPHVGMKLARQIGTITYRSGPEWETRFGRRRSRPEEPPLMCADFMIESYLDYQGENFCLTYDANSQLYISKAMDLFDMSHVPTCNPDKPHEQGSSRTACWTAPSSGMSPLAESIIQSLDLPTVNDSNNDATDWGHRGGLIATMRAIKMPTLVIGCQTDILFPVWQQKEIAECLRMAGNNTVTYVELDAFYGHDTFLIDFTNVGAAVKGFLM